MRIKMSRGDRIWSAVVAVVLILLCLIMLYPMIYVIGRSVMTDGERALNPTRLFPRTFDFSGYKFILFSGTNIPRGYLNTILRTVIGTSINIALTALAAYPLSKKYYPGRKVITGLIVFTMWFSGGMIPSFILIKSLHLINSFWVYIIPQAINAFNLLILRNFFMQVPFTLEEAAKIDGANDMTVFIQIYLPLSQASLATLVLFYAISHWNQWFDGLLYINDNNLWTLQYMLRQLIESTNVSNISSANTTLDQIPATVTVKMATIVISTLPILCIYPFIQKYFVKGVLVGSVKG